jgi:regulatory protein
MVTVTEMKQAEGRGRLSLSFDNGITVLLYRSEAKRFHLAQDSTVTDEEFQTLLDKVVAVRAKKRALHLLEQMDRTEKQLRDKLNQGGYPRECIDMAIDYVKSYHYIDDYRYACSYVRCTMERMSRIKIRQKLLERGIRREIIDQALEENFGFEEDAENLESVQINRLLTKRNFIPGHSDEREFRRTYQFLLRRGYRSNDIVQAMRELKH